MQRSSFALHLPSASDSAQGHRYLTYGIATTQEELEKAFELVWHGYTKVGLHPDDSTGARITKYHLLPDSKVFIAVAWHKKESQSGTSYEPQVVGTLTVLHDGCLGLPSEELCKREIIDMRLQGERIAEFVGLACSKEGLDERVSLKLFTLAYEYCYKAKVTRIIASLTQRHVGFYRRFLGFNPLGDFNNYSLGNGMPVQAHFTDVAGSRDLFKLRSSVLFSCEKWRLFWQNEVHRVIRESSKARPWSTKQMRYFIKRCPNLLTQIDIHTANALSAEYKRYDMELGIT